MIVRVGALAAFLDALGDLQNAVLHTSGDGLWRRRNSASRSTNSSGHGASGCVAQIGLKLNFEFWTAERMTTAAASIAGFPMAARARVS